MLAALAAAVLSLGPVEAARRVVDEMSVPGVDVQIEWQICGQPNAFYYAPTHTIVLCFEDLTDEGLIATVPFLTAHEMGHAVIDQLSLPVTGNDEEAADELASVVLSYDGHYDDVMNGALWLKSDTSEHRPFEAHPPSSWRAENVMCIAVGAEPDTVALDCKDKYEHANAVWTTLIRRAIEDRDGDDGDR